MSDHTLDCVEVRPIFMAGGLHRPPSATQIRFILFDRGVFRVKDGLDSKWAEVVCNDSLPQDSLPSSLLTASLEEGADLSGGECAFVGDHVWSSLPLGENYIFLTSTQPFSPNFPTERAAICDESSQMRMENNPTKRVRPMAGLPSPDHGWIKLATISSLERVPQRDPRIIYTTYDSLEKKLVYVYYDDVFIQRQLLKVVPDHEGGGGRRVGDYFSKNTPIVNNDAESGRLAVECPFCCEQFQVDNSSGRTLPIDVRYTSLSPS